MKKTSILNINRTFWSKANESFTVKERRAFNCWRHDLYVAVDCLRDYVRNQEFMNNKADTGAVKMYIKRVMDQVTNVPIMFGRRSR